MKKVIKSTRATAKEVDMYVQQKKELDEIVQKRKEAEEKPKARQDVN